MSRHNLTTVKLRTRPSRKLDGGENAVNSCMCKPGLHSDQHTCVPTAALHRQGSRHAGMQSRSQRPMLAWMSSMAPRMNTSFDSL